MEHGAWGIEHGAWGMGHGHEHGAGSMEHGVWSMSGSAHCIVCLHLPEGWLNIVAPAEILNACLPEGWPS
ncbi:MAG: hypothetical protein DHS20C17_31600 [Cyclobacteriaceae bacterium]|nr:MAG: hypothetical protein DHS20C17_31600 [Cyclobacteriaceae bacterium]